MDSEGYVAEGPTMNIGIITHEGELVVPPFEQTLAGVTLQRLLHLVGQASFCTLDVSFVCEMVHFWMPGGQQCPMAPCLVAHSF